MLPHRPPLRLPRPHDAERDQRAALLPAEVSVAYIRTGYEAGEHGDEGIEARVRIESSRAINCPSVLAQLAGFKKVQQALAGDGAVERVLEWLLGRREEGEGRVERSGQCGLGSRRRGSRRRGGMC
jgi:hypothetical protein